MKRTVAIAACGFALAGCSGMPSMPSFSLPGFGPPTTTVQFETNPPGAEARTSTGQTCRTPCSLAVSGSEFTTTFTLPGHQPQTVPVRISAATEMVDPNTGVAPQPRMVPNPVSVELQPVAPPPPPPRRRTAPPKPRQQPVAQQPSTSTRGTAPQQEAPSAPAPAPSAAWPPPPPPR